MAFPRILQRLFANSGAGPKLRHDIIPWDEEKSLVALEAWRQAMIGTPMPMVSTTLPPDFMWADGSFAPFETYPELKAKYDAGGFAGMLLAYNASEADIAAYPGKFKPNAANPTGLFLPRLEGLFARYCSGNDGEIGARRTDTGRNLQGGMSAFGPATAHYTGAFSVTSYTNQEIAAGAEWGRVVATFDASRIWGDHVGNEFVPVHYTQPVALYLGRPAEI